MSTQSTLIGPNRWSFGTLPNAAEWPLVSRVLSAGLCGSRSNIDLGSGLLVFGVSLKQIVKVCIRWRANHD
jgi:hypothetical protein